MVDTLVLDLILLALALVVAVATVLVRNLLASAALLAIYSLIMAMVWANMYALDVAFTEASVGAGISTILMIGALVITGTREKAQKVIHWPALIVVLLVGVALAWGTFDMPKFGDPNAPIHNRVYDGYVNQNVGKPHDGGRPGAWDMDVTRDPRTDHAAHGKHDDHAADHATEHGEYGEHAAAGDHHDHGDFSHHSPNLVTAVLASYRGFDTMFETAVIFTAGISIILLLRRRETPAPDPTAPLSDQAVDQSAATNPEVAP